MTGKWLNDAQAAEYIGMSVAYLKKCRVSGQTGNSTPGPVFYRMGRRAVRYSRDDLDQWIAKRRTSQVG